MEMEMEQSQEASDGRQVGDMLVYTLEWDSTRKQLSTSDREVGCLCLERVDSTLAY